MKNHLPTDLVLAITYNCNSRCRMCNIWQKEALPVLGLAEYEKLPNNLTDVNITGGEPFLSPNLIPLIKLLVKKNPRVRIIISTNGFATELIVRQMQAILKIKPDIGLGISLDGIGEIHDQIRGVPGGYEKVLATVKKLQHLGVKNLRLAYTAGDYNIDQLPKVYGLARQLKMEFTLAAVHNSENFFSTATNTIAKLPEFKKEFKYLIKQELQTWHWKNWGRAYFAYGLLKFLETKKRLLPNYSGQDNVFIDPLGDVYSADVSTHLMGNLKDFDSFAGLYNSRSAQQAIVLESQKQNWMMCTVRSAIKRHPWAVLGWVIKAKLLGFNL